MNEIPNRLGQVRRSEFQVNPRGEFCARSKVAATAAAVTLAIALGLVDYLTGREWAISALYLLPTCSRGGWPGVCPDSQWERCVRACGSSATYSVGRCIGIRRLPSGTPSCFLYCFSSS